MLIFKDNKNIKSKINASELELSTLTLQEKKNHELKNDNLI